MTAVDAMHRIDAILSHVWMVRTFLKHCEEAETDDELCEVHRELYDYMLALGGKLNDEQPEVYLKQAAKKLSKLQRARDTFLEIQPAVSTHMNFQMAARSLDESVREIQQILEQVAAIN